MPRGCAGMTAEELGQGLQVGPDNPLTGLEGRAALLRRLGETLAAAPEIFGRCHTPRPSGLFDGLVEQAGGRRPPRPQPS